MNTLIEMIKSTTNRRETPLLCDNHYINLSGITRKVLSTNSLLTFRRVTVSCLAPVLDKYVLSKPASSVGVLPKSGITLQHIISPDSCLLLPSLFMMEKEQQWEADSHEGTASNWFCFGVVHILRVWHSLHPLCNNGSSVAVARPVGPGSSLHTLAAVYLKEENEEWEQPWGWNRHFPDCSNEAFGSSACWLLWQLGSCSKESVYTSRTGRKKTSHFHASDSYHISWSSHIVPVKQSDLIGRPNLKKKSGFPGFFPLHCTNL